MFNSNSDKINFIDTSENLWLLGGSITVPISTEDEKRKFVRYSIKQFKPSSSKRTDISKVDNWTFTGDYLNRTGVNSIPHQLLMV